MNNKNSNQPFFIPDSANRPIALSRTTHLGIGAHQDDLEFMAAHGILECYKNKSKWFGGVTCTDGAGSSRVGKFEALSDDEMKAIRHQEQIEAAKIGKYSFIAQLNHSSRTVKEISSRAFLVHELENLLLETAPKIVYTHNPFDKHPTHVGVLIATIEAIRKLSKNRRPKKVFGCEVWRGLDWLPDNKKVVLDTSAHPKMLHSLCAVFESQIAGGKRYDEAVIGRNKANATFFNPNAADNLSSATYAVDLTPLIEEDSLDIAEFSKSLIQEFNLEVSTLQKELDH